jgi:hypothetical protein
LLLFNQGQYAKAEIIKFSPDATLTDPYNLSSISNETEYFISDIELADPSIGARFDMLAVRWLASDRKDGNHCKAVLIEMKY